MKALSAVNYFRAYRRVDGGVEALLFAVKRLIITAVCVVKCGEKSYTTVIV